MTNEFGRPWVTAAVPRKDLGVHMDFRINHAPVFSTVEFSLAADDYVVAQPNSMLSMTSGVRISAHVGRQTFDGQELTGDAPGSDQPRPRKNSLFTGFKSMLGGESFFTAEFRAKSDDQTLELAPESYGDIIDIGLSDGNGFYLTHGSYLANIGATNLNVKYGGVKAMMSRKGLFLMHATGTGHVFCQSFGAVVHKSLQADEVIFVDNRFVVAFSDTITYRLVKATDSLKETVMSGEGLVNRYTGPGDLYYQTRGKPSGGFLSTLFQAAF